MTITIDVAYPNDNRYQDLSKFVQQVFTDRISLKTEAKPNLFSYVSYQSRPIGCMGLFLSDIRPRMFFEYCDPPGALERLSGLEDPPHQLFGELGARAIIVPQDCPLSSVEVSKLLTAALVIKAEQHNVRYIGFLTNRLAKLVTDALGFELLQLGSPDFKDMSEEFRENFRGFLRTRPFCAGFALKDLSPARKLLNGF